MRCAFRPNILAAMTTTLPRTSSRSSSGSSRPSTRRSTPPGSRSPGRSPPTTGPGTARSTSRPASATRRRPTTPRRNPRVSLLFSDPTGSGIEEPLAVLVQGTARGRRPRPRREPRALLPREPREAARHQGACIRRSRSARMFDWYFMRIYVYVRPERVYVWPEGDFSARAAAVRRRTRGGPLRPFGGAGGRAAGAGGRPGRSGTTRMRELGRRHRHAVLSIVGPDGFPMSARARRSSPTEAPAASGSASSPVAAAAPGKACLTAHEHDPDFEWQVNFQVRGDLVRDDAGWSLVPHRLVGGFELPPRASSKRLPRATARKMRRFRKIAKRELARRRRGTAGAPATRRYSREEHAEQLLLLRRAEVPVDVLDLGVLVQAVAGQLAPDARTACSRRTARRS